jgi:hypothetical protein
MPRNTRSPYEPGKHDSTEEMDVLNTSQLSSAHFSLAHPIEDIELANTYVREGEFQRSLALLTAASSALSGLEVTYEHYRGSYGQRVMYTPVILSAVLTGAGIWAFFSKRAAQTALRWISVATLGDSVIGFYFHIRGIQRKPGGWRLPVINIVMGPPLLAPLLFGTAAYLGLVASYLRREDCDQRTSAMPHGAHPGNAISRVRGNHHKISWKQDIREGKFQKHMALMAGVSALCSGFEALYSHYKNNFRYKSQWSPIVVAPLLAAAAFGSIPSKRIANTVLPAVSLAAMANGAIGFLYHARGVARRPGGRKHLLYNIMYGPPILAPLLFSAAGMLGILATLLRREEA